MRPAGIIPAGRLAWLSVVGMRIGWTTERRTEWLARLEAWTAWPLTALALTLIPLLVAPYVLSLSSSTVEMLDGIDYAIWGIFAADLLVKLFIAPNRLSYLRAHWFDAVLVLLPMLRPFRVARSVRALRLLRASRAIVAAVRVLIIGRTILVRRGLHYVLLAALAVITLGGSLGVVFERDAPDASIKSLPDGLWWAVTTVTTVGYGDMFPRTAAGRGVGVILMLLGISLFGILTANLAAFFVEEREDEVLTELRALRRQVEELSQRPASESDE
ncbi:MAG: voltage-gated potassium channel [Thermomicrobiales bacterium]|nr:voltage-gated potassium channel [Thermomicrobiales bacterium]